MRLNSIGRNAVWMMSEKIISIFGLFFVTSYVAKYIGPSLFGALSLAMAVFQIVQTVAQMGGENIIFKRVAKKVDSGVRLIRASFMLRLALYTLLAVPVVFYFWLSANVTAFVFAISVALACLFSAIDVYTIYNNSTLSSKYNAISNVIGLVTGLGVRYIIARMQLDPMLLGIPIVLTTLIPFLIRRVKFRRDADHVKPLHKEWRKNSLVYSKYMLMAGSAVMLSSISVAVYTRINLFFISEFTGSYQLGIYSVALTLATSWSFFVNSVITSYYTSIYAENDDATAMKQAAKLNRYAVIFSAFFVAFIMIFGKEIIHLLYGDEYKEAYIPVVILCFGTLLSSTGSIAYRYIIKHSGYAYLSKKMVAVFLISIPLSYFLTKYYGITGAAISVVAVEFLSLTIMNYFFNKALILKLHILTLSLKGA